MSKIIKAKIWKNGRGLCINVPRDVRDTFDLKVGDIIQFVQTESGYNVTKLNEECLQ